MGQIEELIENFAKPNFSFNAIMGDIAPPEVLETVQSTINTLTKITHKIKRLENCSGTPAISIKIDGHNKKLEQHLIILKKEVTNARNEGYTITLPRVWENRI